MKIISRYSINARRLILMSIFFIFFVTPAFADDIESDPEQITLATPEITYAKQKSVCKAKLKWAAVENAEYYEVERHYHSWKRMECTEDTTAIIQGVHKKKLKYRVRAVCVVDGEKIYSSYSKPRKVYTRCKVGQARSGDRKDRLGDQSGHELVITSWQCKSKHRRFTMVLRMKDPAKAEKLAYTIERACKGRKVGWTMTKKKRVTFYKELKKVHWDIDKLHKKCATSCTRLACVGINAAGVKFAYDIDSYDMRKEAKKHRRDIRIFTDKAHTRSYKKLKRGDILVDEPHHTVVVL